jgi:flagellar biosynthesis protein FliQ
VPKILSVFVSLVVFGPWMFHLLVQFAVRMLSYSPAAHG